MNNYQAPMNIPKTGPNIGSRQEMKNDKQAYSHVPKKKSINHGPQNTGGVYKPSIIGGGFSANSHKNGELKPYETSGAPNSSSSS